jgi:hypothetical protein
MYLKIALIISVALQVLAAVIAISLIKKTKYNISWILISSGFLLMAVRRYFEISEVFNTSSVSPKFRWDNWIAF